MARQCKARLALARQGMDPFGGKLETTMQTFNVVIEGTSPLLMHRFGDDFGLEKPTKKVHKQPVLARDQAEKVAYRDKKSGGLYLQGVAIKSAIIGAAASHKQVGSRRSLKYVIPGAVRVPQQVIMLLALDRKKVLKDFEIDSRPVTIPSTKGRIMRHRPRLDAWCASFDIRIDEEAIDEQSVRGLLVEAGNSIGLGDFRPQRFGEFGCFDVVHWKAT
jgi:hypothetical protein